MWWLFDPNFWVRQWEGFLTAPAASIILLLIGCVATWWLHRKDLRGADSRFRTTAKPRSRSNANSNDTNQPARDKERASSRRTNASSWRECWWRDYGTGRCLDMVFLGANRISMVRRFDEGYLGF
jgi:hypothetical protein